MNMYMYMIMTCTPSARHTGPGLLTYLELYPKYPKLPALGQVGLSLACCPSRAAAGVGRHDEFNQCRRRPMKDDDD